MSFFRVFLVEFNMKSGNLSQHIARSSDEVYSYWSLTFGSYLHLCGHKYLLSLFTGEYLLPGKYDSPVTVDVYYRNRKLSPLQYLLWDNHENITPLQFIFWWSSQESSYFSYFTEHTFLIIHIWGMHKVIFDFISCFISEIRGIYYLGLIWVLDLSMASHSKCNLLKQSRLVHDKKL